MNAGRVVIVGLGLLGAIAGGVLYYTANYAWYERVTGLTSLDVRGTSVAISDYDGIDSTTSPLKIRGCLRLDPAELPVMEPAPEATPLVPPPWFDCFDAGTLTEDLAAGRAVAHAIADNTPPEEYHRDFAIITYLAVYPDGRAFLWRQRNEV
ncbi:MAG: DUF6446 family protein [Pseudomonadota bacterium]